MTDIFLALVLGPEPAVLRYDGDFRQLFGKQTVQVGCFVWWASSGYHDNLGREVYLELVDCLDVELRIQYLGQDGLSGGYVDQSDTY